MSFAHEPLEEKVGLLVTFNTFCLMNMDPLGPGGVP